MGETNPYEFSYFKSSVVRLPSSIRDTAIKEEQYRIAPVHMLTVELEQVLPLR